jgi:hypothetical protein
MAESPDREPTERELAALADGSLPPARRAAVEARVAASPRLQALLAEQQRAVIAIRANTARAPDSLRAAVAEERARRRPRARARRLGLAAGLTAATVALTLAVILALPGSEAGAPTVAQAARLASRPPERPAPGLYLRHPALLDLELEEVAYPNWRERFGWRAVGTRSDIVEGRKTVTLFYERRGRSIGYTILSGDPISLPAPSRRSVRDGTELRSFTIDGREVVTWLRQRHTCVLSGVGVSRETLLRLGAWQGGGSIPY